MKRKLFSPKNINSLARSNQVEKDYLNQVRQALKTSIETENIVQVQQIISTNKFILNKLATDDNLKRTIRTINWTNFTLDKKDNALHYACRLGKTCLIDIFLDSGYFDVNEKNKSSYQDTPLGIACDLGWLDTAKLLVSRGADVNYENLKSKTPLILSTELIYPFDVQMCKLLLSKGALVNYKTKSSNTALLSASKFGNLELISLLIQANSNINCQFSDGATALMRACYYNFPGLVEILLENNAQIETKNLRQETALYIAAFRGNFEIVKLLVGKYGANVNSEDIDGDTPLAVACYENKSQVISYLLQHGAQVNKKGIRGDTPLHIAVANCDNNVVSELILYGANPDAINNDNETPLHIVLKHNNLETLQSLLKVVRNLDECSYFGTKTPFKYLMENLSVDKLRMGICLVKAGCDVNKGFSGEKIEVIYYNSVFDSPFSYIFKLQKNKFKFYQQLNYFTESTGISLMVNLIYTILQAGYRVRESDLRMYKESWLYGYLDLIDEDNKDLLEDLFKAGMNKPNLAALCRVRIRGLLRKPMEDSIAQLNIPKLLKSFLNLD